MLKNRCAINMACQPRPAEEDPFHKLLPRLPIVGQPVAINRRASRNFELGSNDNWSYTSELPSAIASHIIIPQSIAWRLFTKGIDRQFARAKVTITGDVALAEHVLEFVAIVG